MEEIESGKKNWKEKNGKRDICANKAEIHDKILV